MFRIKVHKMSSPLQNLHSEILQQISEILDYTHPPSLLAFARTCKSCYAIASARIHRTIKLTVKDRQQLVHDTSRLNEILARDGGYAHVRRLIFFFADRCRPQSPYLSLQPYERDGDDGSGLYSCWDLYHADWWSTDNLPISGEEWQPITRLVRQLTGLTDLFWACPAQFPIRLLQALHEDVARCRLHHYNFHRSSPADQPISSYDRAIATSPNLYSIGNLNRKGDCPAFGWVRSLQSPGLKRIHFWSEEDPIVELSQNDTKVSQLVSRECIQLSGSTLNRSMSFDAVTMLASGDFSALRVLKLDIPLAPGGLPAASRFSSLVTFSYTCKITAETSSQYWDEIIVFLRSLPSLTTLRLRDWNRAVSIVPGLSPNLRTLALRTWRVAGGALLDDHIHQLAISCPQLESLAVEIKRSRGDAAEIARYRALGRLPQLRRLDLHLDASPPGYICTPEMGPETGENTNTSRHTAIEAWFDDEDAKTIYGSLYPHRQGHIRDVFINSAIDATLARSIFEVIDAAKGNAPGVRRLERLELSASGGNEFPERGVMRPAWAPLRPFLTALDRRWLVERDVRDDSRGVLHVRETHADDRKWSLDFHSADSVKRSQYYFGLWRRTWPVERDGSEWWDDWESYPLDLGVETVGMDD